MKKTYFRRKLACLTQIGAFIDAVQKITVGRLLFVVALKQRIKPANQDFKCVPIAPKSEYPQPIT